MKNRYNHNDNANNNNDHIDDDHDDDKTYKHNTEQPKHSKFSHTVNINSIM